VSIFADSFKLILSLDPDLFEIIWLSLKVSVSALFISCLLGLPIAGILSSKKFHGKKTILMFFNAMMALPPVFVGLVLYIAFSQTGILGFLNILYTPVIMTLAQIIIIIPIIISVSAEILEQIFKEYEDIFDTFEVDLISRIKTTVYDARIALLTCILTGLGRALSEVGAIIIVGGNIVHYTRVMTTTIALETSKGNLSMAMSLGIVLIFISISINVAVMIMKTIAKKYSYD
tara:strand:- start:2006 stop:2701 length:696 start_codon:yes stop_codon:yes gene_type:complete